MNIISAVHTEEGNYVYVTYDNGVSSYVRDGGRAHKDLQKWVAQGNTIDPYVAYIPTQDEVDNEHIRKSAIKNLAIITVELIDALVANSTISATDFTPAIRQKFQALKQAVDRIK